MQQQYQQTMSTAHHGAVQGVNVDRTRDDSRQTRRTIWRWINTKELIFIFLACSIGAALFQTKDSVIFELAWQEKIDISHYQNNQFPTESEKL